VIEEKRAELRKDKSRRLEGKGSSVEQRPNFCSSKPGQPRVGKKKDGVLERRGLKRWRCRRVEKTVNENLTPREQRRSHTLDGGVQERSELGKGKKSSCCKKGEGEVTEGQKLGKTCSGLQEKKRESKAMP